MLRHRRCSCEKKTKRRNGRPLLNRARLQRRAYAASNLQRPNEHWQHLFLTQMTYSCASKRLLAVLVSSTFLSLEEKHLCRKRRFFFFGHPQLSTWSGCDLFSSSLFVEWQLLLLKTITLVLLLALLCCFVSIWSNARRIVAGTAQGRRYLGRPRLLVWCFA